MIVCGIDPGFSGALAIVDELGDCQTIVMPTLGDGASKVINAAMIARWLNDFDAEYAVLEQAQAMPGQGVSSCFRYGVAYGQITGVLQCGLISYQTVTPSVWKRDMGLVKASKDQSRLRATERLPRAAKQFEKPTDHGRAEAALLALWWLGQHERYLQKQEHRNDKRSGVEGSE